MNDYLLLMHGDGSGEDLDQWPVWLEKLATEGRLRVGSAVGGGECVRRDGVPVPISSQITGFIRIVAADLDDARACLAGNPVYEAGGSVEIRLLPTDG